MVQASVYGKCILADYNAVQKDMCAKEFLRLKDCYLVSSFRGAQGMKIPRGSTNEM